MEQNEKITPFSWLNSINQKTEIEIKDETLKEYNCYLINKSLSYNYDTIMLAGEMNRNYHLDKDVQYQFYLNTVSKKKRFNKFEKPEIEDKIEIIKKYYNYSTKEAKLMNKYVSSDLIEHMRNKVNKGGKL